MNNNNLLYLSGIPHAKVASKEIIDKVVKLVEEKAKEKVEDMCKKLLANLVIENYKIL